MNQILNYSYCTKHLYKERRMGIMKIHQQKSADMCFWVLEGKGSTDKLQRKVKLQTCYVVGEFHQSPSLQTYDSLDVSSR